MNIPNTLTVIRLLLIPVFGYFLFIQNYRLAILLFLISGLTDILDGYIARKYEMITSFGKLTDPIADKLMLITALILLSSQNIILSPVAIIVVAKELLMGIGMMILKKKNIVVSASWYGKLSTVLFYIAIISSIIVKKMEFFKNSTTDLLANIFIVIAVLLTLFAFLMYFMTYGKIIKR